MDIQYHHLTGTFNERGLRLTKPRMRIFDVLMRSHFPLSIGEIKDALGDKVDTATVYRTVKLLESIDSIRAVQSSGELKYESRKYNNANSVHLICRGCGSVYVTRDDEVRKRAEEISRSRKFKYVDFYIQIKVFCRGCA